MADNNSNSSSRSTTNNPANTDNDQSVNGSGGVGVVGASASTTTATERAYIAGNNSIKTLVVLCQGLKKDDGSDFIDIKEEQPWKSVPRGLIKPTATMLREEILRRFEAFGLQEHRPQPNAWSLDKLNSWLHKHPIEKTEDIDFLKKVIEMHRVSAHEAHAAAQIERASLATNWSGKYPYLRLIHCVIDDTIKEAYIRRNDLEPGRMQVENRNSSSREKSVWEKIADLWNDKDFAPSTEGDLEDLHFDFFDPIAIPFDKVSSMTPATPKSVKDKIYGMVTALTRIIGNWERSGQGDGGFHDEGPLESDNPLFGTFNDCSTTARSVWCRWCPVVTLWTLRHCLVDNV